jgi:hypothetical protein
MNRSKKSANVKRSFKPSRIRKKLLSNWRKDFKKRRRKLLV